MLEHFPYYLKQNASGEYYLKNPSNPGENFLKNWNDNEKLVFAFREWSAKARMDIITNPEQFIENDQRSLRKGLLESFGNIEAEKALEAYGVHMGALADSGKMYYVPENGNVTLDANSGQAYNNHTYFGGDNT